MERWALVLAQDALGVQNIGARISFYIMPYIAILTAAYYPPALRLKTADAVCSSPQRWFDAWTLCRCSSLWAVPRCLRLPIPALLCGVVQLAG